MRNIRVHFDNGDSIETRIDGDIQTIVNYYLDRQFPFEDESGKEAMATARSVDFLDDTAVPWNGKSVTVKRVFSLSEQYMRHYCLDHRFRVDFIVRKDDFHDMVYSCAYVPGMFGGY